jgi:hypothetical protein
LLGLGHFALFMVVLALLMLTLLTVYFFLHRRQRFEDIEVQAATNYQRVERLRPEDNPTVEQTSEFEKRCGCPVDQATILSRNMP